MNTYYLDASALVKRYVDETGSAWLSETVGISDPALLLTCRLTIVGVMSAFARRVREESLTLEEYATLRDAFRGDCLTITRLCRLR